MSETGLSKLEVCALPMQYRENGRLELTSEKEVAL